MQSKRILFPIFLLLLAVAAHAQSWQSAYEKGLKAAKSQDWAAARQAFQEAIAYRPDDVSGPTTLPGPVSEQRRWRNGAPYSPNFLAAYSSYRLGIASADPQTANPFLQTAATEFETLLSKGQNSRETFYFLNQIYVRLGDTAKRQDLDARFQQAKTNFRVDTEAVAPEENSVINSTSAGGAKGQKETGPKVTIVRAGETTGTPVPINPNGSIPGSAAVGAVATVPTKYALIIGNGQSRLGEGLVSFGADDAQAVREALVAHAGYAEANVDLVLNATRDQLAASAKALADRIPQDATVFIFFAGNGVNIDGKDYLAGADTSVITDTTSMMAKMDLYRMFMAKGAKIFAFYEVPRSILSGRYFGQEVPLVGAIAQIQSTIPGDNVYSTTRNGRELGVFADALVSTFQELRSNRIPISEFGWQVFNRIRGGGAGRGGGGGRQIPTLPVLTHLSPDERF